MKRRLSAAAAAAALLLAGCRAGDDPAPANRVQGPRPAEAADPAAAAPAPVTPAAPGTPDGLPDDGTPVSEAPFAATSAQGAAEVVQRWFALLEAGKRTEAASLWSGPAGDGRELGDPRLYAEVHGEVGAPGAVEGAAGSSYVTVPVQAYGRRADGSAFRRGGEALLRRVNDVPGSTAEQRRWRIVKIEFRDARAAAP